MILYPAIDLKAGACVRLVRGEMASVTVFNDDPAAQARQFAEMGFAWLHVVDLDGAFAGTIGEWRGGAGDLPGGRSQNPTRRRHPRPRGDRPVAGSRHRPDRPRHGRAARSRAGAPRRRRLPRAGSSSASIRATGVSPSRVGLKPAISARSSWRGGSPMPGSPRSSTPTSRATARCPASMPRRTAGFAREVGVPVIASGGDCRACRHRRARRPCRGRHRGRDLRPRPL